jgi:3,4-dihydroxy 2-butanone 4-phosphate synthase/GTP cyclohydrolase II
MSWRAGLDLKMSKILHDIKDGVPVIVIDDYNREDEGDFIIAGEKASCKNLAFMKKEAGGLMCIPTEGSILDRMQIPMMVLNPTDPHGTPFTVTIDAVEGTTTGMSVEDRLKTIQVLLNENSKPEDLSRPGHMFPLRPKEGLLQERKGHTEASLELVKLAGFKALSVIIEVMNPDGSMSRLCDLEKIADKNGLNIISVEEIIEYVYNKSV